MTTARDFRSKFPKAVKDLIKHHKEGGCIYFPLGNADHKDWAIVIGWQPSEDPDDEYCYDGFRLAAKLAYQPDNSMLQCDFDVDWLLPINDEGDVDDTVMIELYPNANLDAVAKEIWRSAQTYEEIWR